ncbi:MAG: hypothetical protein ACI4IW_01910 [Oscillospiraceae bacterium]
MTENDPLRIIESDERFLPPEEKPRQKSRGESLTEHMFAELFKSVRRHGEE